jgi:hypothetical protein
MGIVEELAAAREREAKRETGLTIADVEEAMTGSTELIHKERWKAIVRFLRDEHHPTRWHRVVFEQRVAGYRPGWVGVWDHFVAWARNRPGSPLVEHKIQISAWVRGARDGVKVAAVMEESRPL